MFTRKFAVLAAMASSLTLMGGCYFADVWWHWVILGAGVAGLGAVGGVSIGV